MIILNLVLMDTLLQPKSMKIRKLENGDVVSILVLMDTLLQHYPYFQ